MKEREYLILTRRNHRMILKIVAHTREVHQSINADGAQSVLGADARNLEKRWRPDRAGGQDHFALGRHLLHLSIAIRGKFNASGLGLIPRCIEDNSAHSLADGNVHVAASEDRVEVGGSRGNSALLLQSHTGRADAGTGHIARVGFADKRNAKFLNADQKVF
jgi:hypothetical protein